MPQRRMWKISNLEMGIHAHTYLALAFLIQVKRLENHGKLLRLTETEKACMQGQEVAQLTQWAGRKAVEQELKEEQ